MGSNEKFLSACGQRAILPPLESRGLPSPERVNIARIDVLQEVSVANWARWPRPHPTGAINRAPTDSTSLRSSFLGNSPRVSRSARTGVTHPSQSTILKIEGHRSHEANR